MPQKQKATPAEKVRVIREFLAGHLSQSQAARTIGVDRSTFRGWIMQYQSEGDGPYDSGLHSLLQCKACPKRAGNPYTT
ncbi:MAG: helix-turn-helix domain-containing protein [Selenomonas sp.]|nr:helix-turn-helix domain-containing protein [Selenomonas sp.]